MMPTVAIDPNLHSTGVAFFIGNRLVNACTIVQRSSEAHWMARALTMAYATSLTVHAAAQRLLDVIIEAPANWQSERGRASKDRGDVQKLYFLVGAMAHECWRFPTYLIEPAKWKGQTPKKIMMARAFRFYPKLFEDATHDACEAALLGRYADGKRSKRTDMGLSEADGFIRVSSGLPSHIMGRGMASVYKMRDISGFDIISHLR